MMADGVRSFVASVPKRIQVFEDTVYVMTYDQKVMAFNKFASTRGSLLLDGTHRASDILILHPLKQKRDGKCVIFIQSMSVN